MAEYKYKNNLQFSVLTDEGKKRIHEKSLELLGTVGIRVDDADALKMLTDRGATIREDDGYVQLPADLIEWALSVVPKKLVLYDRLGNENIVVDKRDGGKSVYKYFGSMSDGLEFLDPYTEKVRQYEIKDSTMMLKLCDSLDSIRFVLATGIFHGEKTDLYTQLFVYKTLTECTKTMLLATNDSPAFMAAVEMLQIAAGGADKLREKPFAFTYTEPIPPFIFPVETTDRIRTAANAGLPIISMPYSMMGGTSPMSKTMALVQNNSEILAGLVFAQLYREGNGYIYASMPTIFDMQTTIGSYAAPEFHLNIVAASEMATFYGLPMFGTAGASDAKSVDIQASCEATMEIMSAFLGQSDIIHDVGFLNHAMINSPKYLILGQELIEMTNAYATGVDAENDEIDMAIYEDNKLIGHYLEDDQTLENYKIVRYSEIFTRKMDNPDESEVAGKILDKITKITTEHKAVPMDPENKAALDAYMAKLNLKEELEISEASKN